MALIRGVDARLESVWRNVQPHRYIIQTSSAEGRCRSRPSRHGVTVVHALRGRTRFRSPTLKRHPHLRHDIGKQMSALPGIRHVETNPETGSVILHHEPDAMRSAEMLATVVEILGAAALDPEELPELLATLAETEQSRAEASLLTASLDQLAERLDAKTLVRRSSAYWAYGACSSRTSDARRNGTNIFGMRSGPTWREP